MSSSARLNENLPASISDRIVSRPWAIFFASSAVMMPCLASIVGMGLGRGDVLAVEMPVEIDGDIDFLHDRAGT
jgi:uncharacterized membrane protein YdfJ with MMPL/SSD domain